MSVCSRRAGEFNLPRVAKRSFAALIFIASFGLGCAEERRPNVLVILIDALRADRLGCYGYPRSTSPNIDAFAAESVVFDHAYAQSPWTKPSIPTLFTSLYPVQHGVYEGEAHARGGALESDVLSQSHSTLAESFRDSGYDTVAFVNNAHLDAAYGLAQGFDTYDHGPATAQTINAKFIEFLSEDRERPFFAYLHYLDAHWPFQPDEPFRARFRSSTRPSVFDRESWSGLRKRINDGTIQLSPADLERLQNLHDAGIAEMDHNIGMLLRSMRERGLLDETIVLLTSDHGEELMDHGRIGHGGTLYREVIDIPLMIRLPDGARAGRRDGVARLIDVFPTLAALAGIKPPAGLEGRNLFASETAVPEIVAETRHKQTYRVSLRRGDWKYVRTYRAKRFSSERPQAEQPHLEPGMRIKAKGFFLPNRIVQATKISRKDPGDDDLEISGVVVGLSPGDRSFELHGLKIEAGDLLGSNGMPITDGLHSGDWVKVEGKLIGEGVLRADKFKRLAKGDREDEIEAVVVRIEATSEAGFEIAAGSFRITVTRDTRLRGFAGVDLRKTPIDRADAISDDPFSPTRLLSAKFEEQLFDLARDPGEQVDRISDEPAHAEPLRKQLDAWLLRVSQSAAKDVARKSLDAATIEELRALGYLD